jgi:hypothetical protein
MIAEFPLERRRRGSDAVDVMTELRIFLAARENARRFGLPVTAAFDEHLMAAVESAMQPPQPEEYLTHTATNPRDSLVIAAELLRRPFASRS